MTISRVRQARRAAHFPLRFWRGDRPEEAVSAFVSNVSAGGMFITTRRPFPPGTPIELEVERPTGKVRISARVVHAARIPPMYQRVFKSGMGVRFLRPEESAVREISALGVALPDRGGRREYPR